MRAGRFKSAVGAVGIALAAMLVTACGQDVPAFSPPLLMDTAGLGQQFPLAAEALGPDGQTQGTFPAGIRFQAHVVGLADGAVLAPELDPDRAAGLALYGPRRPDGLFGLALSWDSAAGNTRASLSPRDLAGGDYLLLVADLSGRGGTYHLRAACQANCGQPACDPLVFGDYCANGLAQDGEGCPADVCSPGCSLDTDCPAGFTCVDHTCTLIDTCEQCGDEPYDPVCGVDGQTYANDCERICASVSLDHAGSCREPGCTTDAECPAGMHCQAGLCTASCDCSGEPYAPVCGVDGLTYPNDCERDCAQVGLDHQGPCETCIQEVCGDGQDNDCDGLIDEGCSDPCASDADCPAGQMCIAGFCSVEMACATHADCPAGQVCMEGICRQDCTAEVCDGLDNDCDGEVDEDFDLQTDPLNCGACGWTCAAGETCQSGACVEAPCRTNDDCPAGQQCDAATGQCVAVACSTDADCPAGQVCVAGTCVEGCVSNADCDAGHVCVDGLCEPGCASDADCAAGEVCVDGLCEPDVCDTDADGDGYLAMVCGGMDCNDSDPTVHPGAQETCDGQDNDCDGEVDEGCQAPCASDADCAAGQVCVAGTCFFACASDADCGAGEACFNGACVVPCVTDGDCPAGWTCNVGERICQP